MGEWDGLPQASQYAPTQQGLGALFQRLEAVDRLLRQLTGANILAAADVVATKGGLTIASELKVTGQTRIDGPLEVTGAGHVAGPLSVTGDMSTQGRLTVEGPAEIKGTLSLPAGVVDNEALASPVRPASLYTATDNDTTLSPSAWTAGVTAQATVPAGFTAAVVSVTSKVTVQNNASNNTAQVSGATRIAGAAGFSALSAPVEPGTSGSVMTTYARTLTGLTPGQTFDCQALAYFSPAPAYISSAGVAGTILWFR